MTVLESPRESVSAWIQGPANVQRPQFVDHGLAIFWVSVFLMAGVVGLALSVGGTILVDGASLVLLLPHLLIGDLFHWRHFPHLGARDKATWVILALLGFLGFLLIRSTGEYVLPLFYVYFFGHFWKDFDMAFRDPASAQPRGDVRRPKRWCGMLLFVAYAVISSGLVKDPLTIMAASWIARAASGLLLFWGIRSWRRARSGAEAVDVQWGRYATFSSVFLMMCAWLNARHPFHNVLPHAIIIWHFMLWYAFYGVEMVRAPRASMVLRAPRGLALIQWSPLRLLVLVVAVNLLAAAGAWLYVGYPSLAWLRYVYSFNYFAGGWTVMHVTWDWLPSRVKGIQLSVF